MYGKLDEALRNETNEKPAFGRHESLRRPQIDHLRGIMWYEQIIGSMKLLVTRCLAPCNSGAGDLVTQMLGTL